MPRPRNFRRVGCMPQANYFKPRGIPLSVLQHITLTVDELEAIRLTDLQGLYQEQAAEKMNISRQTFGRIIESAPWLTARLSQSRVVLLNLLSRRGQFPNPHIVFAAAEVAGVEAVDPDNNTTTQIPRFWYRSRGRPNQLRYWREFRSQAVL
jgi:predicted DNA-binding protein (UPF0251 family)